MLEMTSPARRLRRLLEGDNLVVAPGAFSPIVAKLVEESGFPAVYVTGAGVAQPSTVCRIPASSP